MAERVVMDKKNTVKYRGKQTILANIAHSNYIYKNRIELGFLPLYSLLDQHNWTIPKLSINLRKIGDRTELFSDWRWKGKKLNAGRKELWA